jgi:hypothetical protein
MSIQDKIKDWCKKLNRKAKYTITFLNYEEGFSSFFKAVERSFELGYSAGMLCGDDPIALAKSAEYNGKWKDIPEEEYPKIEGLILSNNFIKDEVAVVVFE